MKKLLTLLIVILSYNSIFSQDAVVDVLKWNINPDPNTSFWQNSAVISPTYTLGVGLLYNSNANQGYSWKGITTGDVLATDKISIEFTIGGSNVVEITNIEFSAANFINFGIGWRVNHYQLDYVVNGTDTVNIIELPDGNISSTTSGGTLDNRSINLNIPVVLEPGDTFELIWSPFDADQDAFIDFTSFFLADSTLVGANMVKLAGVVRPYSVVSPITNFGYSEGCASAGSLSWTNPDMTNRQVLVFAKKTSYIDQGTPVLDPSTYGAAITDLSQMTVSVPLAVQYENDAAAMLIYSGTGTSVDLTNFDNGIDYQFAAFVVDATTAPIYVYSNAKLASGNSANTLNEIVSYTALSRPAAADLTFVQPNCFDKIVIVAKAGIASTTAPTGTNNFTASSVLGTFIPGTGEHDGGQVMYNGVGTGVNLTNLTNGQQYGISIWIESAGNWSSGTFFTVYPEEYEVIITQVKAVDDDAVEFLTLKEIDFSTANYNLGSFPACSDGIIVGPSSLGTQVFESFFDNVELNGITGDIIPAGTFIRVIKGDPLNNDPEAKDGMVTLYSTSNLALETGGDQAMLFINDADGYLASNCSGGNGNQNLVKSAINFGNDGWLEPGSMANPSLNSSYAPPSVSNLAQPVVIPDLYPNYALKDQNAISGTIAEIHSTISEVDNSNVWFANSESDLAILKLKDIKIDPTNFASAGTWLSSSTSGEVDIDLTQLTFDDEADVRYMAVVHAVFQGDIPVDRYTCYTSDLDYNTADAVVTSTSGQTSASPCGTPTTGFGYVVYFDRAKVNPVTVTGLPCGTRVFVDVYAVKGNGYTMSLGTPASDDILLAISTPTDYYSQGSGNIDDAIWDIVAVGTGAVIPEDYSSCINLIIQAGHTVTFNQTDMEIGSLTIEATATAEVLSTNILTIERDLTINGSFVANNSTINLDGKYGGSLGFGAQVISGTATGVTFCKLRINNTSPTTGLATDNDVNFNIDANVTYGMRVDDGDFIIGGAYMITLVSDVEDYAAYLGALGGPDANTTASISGNINAQRFIPLIATTGSVAQFGIGWRYIGVPVENADFTQIMDDFWTGGFFGSVTEEFFGTDNYYFPTIKKYDETVTGNMSEGFDNDHDPVNGEPQIRFRRNTANASEVAIAPGEGVLAYLTADPLYNYNNGILDAIGQPVTGNVDLTLTFTTGGTGTSTDNGWHLVANPYPCAIDWKLVNFSSAGGFNDGTIYIWNTDGGVSDYVELNKGFAAPQYIAAHQAFWIKTNNGEITLQFREDNKIENPNGLFYKSNDEDYEEALIVKVLSADSILGNRAVIWFKEDASMDFDNAYDSYKLFGSEVNYPVLSSNIDGLDKHISTNAIPELTEDHVITFNLFVRSAGDYTLSFKENGYILEGSCVTMTDLVNDSTFIVDESTVYSFYSDLRADTAAAMFSMTISPSVSIESTNATCFEGDNGTATALGVGDGPFTYTWYDANNEVILTETSSIESSISDLSQGFYSVEIDGNSTFCNLTTNEIYIMQPSAFENATSKVDPVSCTYANGYIEVTMDIRAMWDIAWTNIETGQTNQVLGQTDSYTIADLGAGSYEVVLTTDCGTPFIFEETLVDNNDVVADFTLETDTVWLADGGAAQFFNISENSSNWYWLYDNTSVEPDNSFDGNYTYTEPGVYGVTLIAQSEGGCSDILTQEIVVMADPTGIDDISNGIVRAYISYSNGNPQYVIELQEDKEVNVQMLNTMGQVINSQAVNVSGKTYVDLPTYDLSSGIYLIITLADGTRIDTQKLFVR